MFDALIGLAYPQFAHEGITPFFDALVQRKVLKNNLFSWYMSQHLHDKSELLFGDINQERYSGEMVYHNVIDQRFFALQLDDVLLNG